jgi:hypothetical protein
MEALKMLLPLYQAVTTVSIRNGRNTSIYHDAWNNEEALAV